jgi:tRNA dimethylallyltransferase
VESRPVSDYPLIVVAGPTGSGKSALALHLAAPACLGKPAGEIVNFDSMQVYRGFDIGTAKTPLAECGGVAHHLIGVAEANDVFSAGDFARSATSAIADIASRGRLPVLVGGTGFYLRALLDGLFEGPARDESLRARLSAREAVRPGSLHRLLQRLDPASAARIHAADKHKTTRALEVRLLTGGLMAEAFSRETTGLAGYRVLKLGLNPDREALYDRLNTRAQAMFANGLLQETAQLLARYPAEAKPFAALGYAQATRHLRGECTLDQAIAETQTKTRQYAKRQWTWFRADSEFHWLAGFGDDPAVQAKADRLLSEFGVVRTGTDA